MNKSLAFFLLTVFLIASPLQAAQKSVLVYFTDEFNPFAEPLARDRSNRVQLLKAMTDNHEASRQAMASVLEGNSAVSKLQYIRIINGAAITADERFIEELESHPRVKRIIEDLPIYPPKTIEPTVKGAPSGPYAEGLPQIKATDVWQAFGLTGAGIVVGHIDTGADGSHPDLAGKIVAYNDYVDEANSTPTDTGGHGTHTAGTICGGNTSGVAIGVAPGAKLVVARAIGYGGSTAALLSSMDWMCDPDHNPNTDDGPRVVSCSWHSGYNDQTPFYEALDAWVNLGIFPNFSAGNSGPGASTITHPKEHPYIFCSAAVDFNDKVTSFSSRGPAEYKGQQMDKPEIAAPGNDVYSAKNGGGYKRNSGTSMACPHTAGVIALMLEANPGLTIADIRRVLAASSDDKGDSGYDWTYGHGRINALKAIEMVATGAQVLGNLVDKTTGAPLSGTIRVVERDYTINVGPDGSFKAFLPEGTYTLVGRAFAYRDKTATVTVEEGDELSLLLDLEKAPTITLQGKVIAADSGAPLAAKVEVIGAPVAPVDTDATTGAYEIGLPSGTYTFKAFSFGYKPLVLGPLTIGQGSHVDFTLEGLPPVVVVDDDASQNYEKYYTEALTALEVEFDLLPKAPASLDEILGYDTVIWFTGKASSKTLEDGDQQILKAYLEAGGTLLVSGMEIGYNIKGTDFYTNVLQAKYLADKAKSKDVSGLGQNFKIEGGTGANNQSYPDVIEATTSQLVYSYGDGSEGAAVQATYGNGRLTYFAFGIEGIDSADNRAAVIDIALKYLTPTDEELVQRLVLMDKQYRSTYLFSVLIPRLGHERVQEVASRTGVRPLLRALRVIGRR